MQELAIDNWPYWLLEENIKLVNELTEEEENHRRKEEGDQTKNMPNYDSAMKNMNMNMPNFSMPKF